MKVRSWRVIKEQGKAKIGKNILIRPSSKLEGGRVRKYIGIRRKLEMRGIRDIAA